MAFASACGSLDARVGDRIASADALWDRYELGSSAAPAALALLVAELCTGAERAGDEQLVAMVAARWVRSHGPNVLAHVLVESIIDAVEFETVEELVRELALGTHACLDEPTLGRVLADAMRDSDGSATFVRWLTELTVALADRALSDASVQAVLVAADEWAEAGRFALPKLPRCGWTWRAALADDARVPLSHKGVPLVWRSDRARAAVKVAPWRVAALVAHALGCGELSSDALERAGM